MSQIKLIFLAAIFLFVSACNESTSIQPGTEEPESAQVDAPQMGADERVTAAVPEAAISGEPEADQLHASDRVLLTTLSQRMAAPWTGDFDLMQERRIIRVLTVYSLGRYYIDGAQEKGITSEMFKLFEDFVNKRAQRGHLRIHVVLIPVARDELIPGLLEGRGDVAAAGITITPERAQMIEFSEPASRAINEILITGPAAPVIASIDDLSGQTIHIRTSSSYRESLDLLNQRFTEHGKAPVNIESISEVLEDDDLIEMVNAGLLPWAIVDDYKMGIWSNVFENLIVRDDIVFREGGRIGWAFRANSPLLEAEINEFLKAHRQGTMIGNMLVNRYLKEFDYAANALAPDDYGRFEAVVNIFQTYGDQYGFDFLMVAAQGYQESRLDQSQRSNRGAVGVMQLLPSTAADSNVGIPDIYDVESNIHAGVKYLDFIRDRYFDDPGITRLNQTLMSFAAYNAGPARVRQLREKAEQQGYDPNVWFDNVEIIAAMEIGRETVQYVSNIFKYYMAYSLSAENIMKRHEAREKAGVN